MSTETPRDADGNKVCAWCGGPIRQSGVGRSRDYCRRSCRQRAYEARTVTERLKAHEALIWHLARQEHGGANSSRDESPGGADSSRDEMAGAGDYLPAPPGPPAEAPAPRPRRAWSPVALWAAAEDEGEPDARPTTEPR
ncbi:hypothetical protein [Streptomyces sp. Ru62]|uniref:hypothetical protein n=1 Tax=Streptomyces sp. Ru62 TaxID=2080745 RepID=UPI0011AFD5B9|nr:hypothetical protein [Streptomyces sp. Ru62]